VRAGTAILVAAILVFGTVVTAQSDSGSAVEVTIIADGQEWGYVSTQSTVGGVLREAGVTLGALDRCTSKLSSKVSNGMRIRVIRIEEKILTTRKPVEFETVVKYDPLHRGGNVVLQKGEPGEKDCKLRVFYKDGAQSSVSVLEVTVTKQPKDQIVVSSERPALSSRGGFSHRGGRVMRMHATAYDPGPRSCGPRCTGRTATGMKAQKGVVAVDPRVIPLGTKLYVEGYGYCVAADTGGAIKGNRIDLCFNTYGEAIRFGRKWVMVEILK
jgi:3D (Asp-Asp-Asp) domain-containing protein